MKRLSVILFSLLLVVGFTCIATVYSVNASLSRVPEDELWRITELGRVHDPIISGDFLLFKTHNGKDCHCVFTVDKLTGDIVWSTEELASPYIEEYKKTYPDSTRVPAFVELYGAHDEQGIVYIILNYLLYALDRSNGDVLWGPIKLSGNHYAESAYVKHSNNVIYVLAYGGNLLALDAVTGDGLWSRSVLSEETHSAYLKLYENKLYVVSRYSGTNTIDTITAFASMDGQQLWTTEIASVYYGKLFLENTLVVGTSGSGWDDALPIAAFELDGGTRLWETQFEEKGNDDVFPSIAEDQLFLVIDEDNDGEDTPSRLVVMDTNTGELLWEFNQSFSHEKITYYVSGEIVYAGTQDGY